MTRHTSLSSIGYATRALAATTAALLLHGPMAASADSVVLHAVRSPLPDGGTFTWSGAGGVDIYRSPDRTQIAIPAYWQGVTAAPPWTDAFAAATVLFYQMSPACGNSRLDPTEQCDDGNTVSGDGCSADCKLEASACDPDGTYAVLTGGPVAYTCCLGLVDVSVTSFTFSADGIQVTAAPQHPVALIGAATTCPSGTFDNGAEIQGGCTEHYALTGGFTGPDTWSGTYRIFFTGAQCGCFGIDPCVDQAFPITASR